MARKKGKEGGGKASREEKKQAASPQVRASSKEGGRGIQGRKQSAQKKKKRSSKSFIGMFANHVGIDLGTATTMVFMNDKGVILQEPTLVAVNKRTEQVVAIGRKARMMIGRTPQHIEVVHPIQQGVIYDYEVTEQIFRYIFRKAQGVSPRILGPLVTIGVPCDISQAEISAVRDAVIDAGARKVSIVYEPFAAAVGMKIPIQEEKAVMVIDVGGGTSDAMIIAGGEIVATSGIRVAGNTLDAAIVKGLREKKHIIVSPHTAEDLKIATMRSAKDQKVFSVRGRNSNTGLPLETEVSFKEIVNFITPCLEKIVEHVGIFISKASPEIQADLKDTSIFFVGGGPAIHTFSERIEASLGLRVTIPENPTSVVAKGAVLITQDFERYEEYFLP